MYHTMRGMRRLKVALPPPPADAKGLMAASIRDNNPVVYLHHYMLTLDTGEVPDGEYVVPFGVADIKRAGNDVSEKTVFIKGVRLIPQCLNPALNLFLKTPHMRWQ